MDDIKNMLLEILGELHPEIDDWESNNQLVHSGLLNSLDIVTLIAEISDIFDIAVPPQEITYDNFDSLNGLIHMIEKLSE